MKTFILLLALCAITTAFPLGIFNTRVGDIPSCATDLHDDFDHMDAAIKNKDWNELFALLKNVSKTYADCKDGYNQVATCITDAKGVASNIADIINAVKSKDMNPFHYIKDVKSLYTSVKTLTHDCYVTKPTAPVESLPQDLAKCGSDLKAEFQDIADAFHNKDMSKIDDMFQKFSTTFLDCQVAYEDVATCTAPVIGTITDVVTLIKMAEAKDMNPLHYINSVKSLVGHVEAVAHECFNH